MSPDSRTYVVVHTLGGDYTDVGSYTYEGGDGLSYAYTDALDHARSIRSIPGNYARIDVIRADGSREIL